MFDSFERPITYLRLSVTDLCNLRCRYCMPEAGVRKLRHDQLLTEDEMIRAVEAAAKLGVTRLRVTGGEPLIKPNILSLCRRASRVPGIKETAITTNATRLPDMAAQLRAAGIRRVNISLDTLNPDKYAHITRGGKLNEALRGLDAAMRAGFERIKLNAVLIGGFNDDEIPALAAMTREYPVDVRFIEMMPMSGNAEFGQACYIPVDRVLEALPEAQPEASEGVAQLYRLPGARGRVGLISPISRPFCASCNRIRVTADGRVKPCLHSAEEFPLKGLNDGEMLEQMRRAIWSKPCAHREMSAARRSETARNMSQIGG